MFDLPNLPLIQLLLRILPILLLLPFKSRKRFAFRSLALLLCNHINSLAISAHAASNITDFCVLKGIWANAFNVTSIETVAGWMENNEFCEWVGVTCDQGGGVVALQLAFPNVPNVFIDNLGNLEKLSTS